MSAIVYAPFTGYITTGNGSCAGGSPCNGGSYHVDDAGHGAPFYLYVNSAINQVLISIGKLCCDASKNTEYRQTVQAYLYGPDGYGHQCLYGWILFGHMFIYSGLQSGLQSISGSLRLGNTVPTELCTCNQGCCYCGEHVHMEIAGRYGSWTSNANCGTYVTEGTTPIYSWSSYISPCQT